MTESAVASRSKILHTAIADVIRDPVQLTAVAELVDRVVNRVESGLQPDPLGGVVARTEEVDLVTLVAQPGERSTIVIARRRIPR